jgi:hypothetical protein
MQGISGLSDKAQAVLMIVSMIAITVGAYLSTLTGNATYVVIGGVLAAIGVGIKEALGAQVPSSPQAF